MLPVDMSDLVVPGNTFAKDGGGPDDEDDEDGEPNCVAPPEVTGGVVSGGGRCGRDRGGWSTMGEEEGRVSKDGGFERDVVGGVWAIGCESFSLQ